MKQTLILLLLLSLVVSLASAQELTSEQQKDLDKIVTALKKAESTSGGTQKSYLQSAERYLKKLLSTVPDHPEVKKANELYQKLMRDMEVQEIARKLNSTLGKIDSSLKRIRGNIKEWERKSLEKDLADVEKQTEMLSKADGESQQELLKKAEETISKLKEVLSPSDPKVKTDEKVETPSKTEAGESKKPVNPSQTTKKETDALPATLKSRIDRMHKLCAQFEAMAKQGQDTSLYVSQVEDQLSSTLRVYKNYEKHPEILQLKEKINLLKTGIDKIKEEAEAKQKKEQAEAEKNQQMSKAWEDRLAPFINYQDKKYLDLGKVPEVVNNTNSTSEDIKTVLENILPVYREAKSTLAESRALSIKKSSGLLTTEDKIDGALGVFVTNFRDSLKNMLKSVEDDLQTKEATIKRFQEQAEKDTVNAMAQRHFDEIQKNLDKIKSVVQDGHELMPENFQGLEDAEKRLSKVEEANKGLLRLRAQKTFVKPEKYKGSDAEALRQAVIEILKEKHPEAEVLTVSLYSENWEEKSEWEWTDTTQTGKRFRTWREQYAQIVYRLPGTSFTIWGVNLDGDYALVHVVYFYQDKQENGWEKTKGNLTEYPDPISLKNVK